MRAGRLFLSDPKVHIKLRLAALWTAVMFCYVYGDFIGLFKTGKLAGMLAGRTPLGPTTQGVLLGEAIFMSLPSAMTFLSLVLSAGLNRWANIVLAGVFTLAMIATMPGAWSFYIYLGCVEVVLTAVIIWQAWSWPRQADPD